MKRERVDDVRNHIGRWSAAQVPEVEPHGESWICARYKQLLDRSCESSEGWRSLRSLELLKQLAMVCGHKINSLGPISAYIFGHLLKQGSTLVFLQLAEVFDHHKLVRVDLKILYFSARIPLVFRAPKRAPNLATVIRFSVPRRTCQYLGPRICRSEVAQKILDQRRRQHKRRNLKSTYRPLDRFIIHVIVCRDRTVVSYESNPIAR